MGFAQGRGSFQTGSNPLASQPFFFQSLTVYQSIFDLLDAVGIRTIADVRSLAPDYDRGAGFSFLTTDTYPWVQDVFRVVARHYDVVLASYQSRVARAILIDRAPGGIHQSEGWTATDPLFRMRSSYGCILPDQCLFSCNQFIASGDDFESMEAGSECISKDFLPMLFTLRPLLLSGLATLLPRRINYQNPHSSGRGMYPLSQLAGTIMVGDAGRGARAARPHTRAGDGVLDPAQPFFIKMPWLKRVRMEDMVEVSMKHPSEFQLYTHTLGRTLAAATSADEALLTLADELKAATLELEVLYQNKQRELRRKGFDAAMGGFLTVGTLVVPGGQSLAPLFGGKTAWDCFRLLQDFRELRSTLGREKGWVLWSLKQGKA